MATQQPPPSRFINGIELRQAHGYWVSSDGQTVLDARMQPATLTGDLRPDGRSNYGSDLVTSKHSGPKILSNIVSKAWLPAHPSEGRWKVVKTYGPRTCNVEHMRYAQVVKLDDITTALIQEIRIMWQLEIAAEQRELKGKLEDRQKDRRREAGRRSAAARQANKDAKEGRPKDRQEDRQETPLDPRAIDLVTGILADLLNDSPDGLDDLPQRVKALALQSIRT